MYVTLYSLFSLKDSTESLCLQKSISGLALAPHVSIAMSDDVVLEAF